MGTLRVGFRRAIAGGLGLTLAGSALVAFSAIQLGTSTPAAATPSPLCGSPVVTGSTAVVTCSYTGGAQYFVVPTGISSVVVDAYGAQGGASAAAVPGPTVDTEPGGLGGHTEATLSVTGGETLQVNVGGEGGDGSASASDNAVSVTGGTAGWNGGRCGWGVGVSEGSESQGEEGGLCVGFGISTTGTPDAAVAAAAGGSGGASDVRDGSDTTADRLVVAGGGGGGGACASSNESMNESTVAGSSGGAGGGTTGGTGSSISPGDGGAGGTQMSGGTGGTSGGTTATDDQGAVSGYSFIWGAVPPAIVAAGGPGGAGYYGGGSGSNTPSDSTCGAGFGGGGGGSSYPTSATTLAQGVRSGNGLVTFTYTLYVPTLSTSPSSTSVSLPGSAALTDTATIAGGYDPTGTITFTLYNPGGTLVDTETATVSGDGTYSTPTGYVLPTTGTVTGTYQWDATYSGDSNNTSVTDDNNADEQVTVQKGSTSLTTRSLTTRKLTTLGQRVVDETVTFWATLTSRGQGIAGQRITFTVASGGSCTGPTNAEGVATCQISRPEPRVSSASPYTASYAGSDIYSSSNATGYLSPMPTETGP